MSRLQRGLSRLANAGEPAANAPREARLAELRTRIEAVLARRPFPARGDDVSSSVAEPRGLPMRPIETSDGRLYLQRASFDLEHRHGAVAVGACLQARAELYAKLALDPRLAAVAPKDLLFFDLETTGLAGGTGTLPFLVGLGFFAEGRFCVEQLFLPRPGEEAPMLAHLRARFAKAAALVSFNGKSFDWPLLRTRFMLNRVALPKISLHLDLLHTARRVFRRRLLGARLGTIEREVLGYEREGDIDGAEIPATYFGYLRSGDASPLAPVFHHNVLDLLALAALLARLSEMFASITCADPRDQLGLAENAARARDDDRALAFARDVTSRSSGRYAREGLVLAAKVHKRRGDYAEAARLFEQALAEDGTDAARAHLELAKLYEHRLHDRARALTHARCTVPAETPPACAHRLARLARHLDVEERR